jgi:putative acyl-CoA dehydrogenase
MPVAHEVVIQVPPPDGTDLANDPVLLEALHREGAGWAEEQVRLKVRRAGQPATKRS